MALVKYGGGIIQMSGSMAGNTHARNRYGNYIRARTKPINPQTALQTQIRAAIQLLTTYWSQTLSDAQRIAWNLYADSVNMKNRLGEVVHLSGFNHFIRSNVLGQRAGIPIYADGPTTFELPEADPTFAVAISEATQLISVTFDDGAAWNIIDDGHMFIEMGSPQNPQRNFFDGPWRYAGQIPGDTAVPLTSPQTKACPFAATELQRVWCYARIQMPDGRLSEVFRANTFCAA
jgi:hypothetical protein